MEVVFITVLKSGIVWKSFSSVGRTGNSWWKERHAQRPRGRKSKAWIRLWASLLIIFIFWELPFPMWKGCQSHPFHNEREHVTQAGQTENAAYFTLIFLKNVNGTVLGHSAPWESDWDKKERSIFSFVWHQHLWRWYKPKAMEAVWRNPIENEVNSEKHQAKNWWGHEIMSLQHCLNSQIHPYLKPIPKTLQLPTPIKFPYLLMLL